MTSEDKKQIITGELAQVDSQISELKKQLEQLQQILVTFEVIRESYQGFLEHQDGEQLLLDFPAPTGEESQADATE
jgi:hypothetical protein